MTPYEHVRALYIEKTPNGRMSWEELVGYALASPHFHVVKEVDFFVMGRPVPKGVSPELLDDPTTQFPPDSCDAWQVWAIGGSVAKALTAMRQELPWVCFQRHGEQSDLRFYRTDTIRRLNPPDAQSALRSS